jgi:hypothetical protein
MRVFEQEVVPMRKKLMSPLFGLVVLAAALLILDWPVLEQGLRFGGLLH